ncbi:hypothetical protein DUNSADRAFT_2094 [Dunaliella salina]|uniref:BAH domain-containing protein n=1 Tax=Dunaliella salina TaxID=3046 RepID=A0ABQ7GW51_DUNSA|nr:hypothetical protein DUNSADRAFT_2094 [Dunaliella salina]|eukprot:KAF5838836.1 hypothetical protein DUNSADRAFT_2094 [Dunaliella salina]
MSMARKKKQDPQQVPEEEGDWVWIGEPIPRDEVRQRWPKRKTCYDENPVIPADYFSGEHATADEENNSYIAKAHYRAVKLQEGSIVKLGDDVMVAHEDGGAPMRVLEMFEDIAEGIYFNGHYFYKPEETVMANTVMDTRNKKGEVVVKFLNDERIEGSYKMIEVAQINRRLYWATDEDNAKYRTVQSVTSIDRLTRVQRIRPTDPVPPAGTCDFWFDQTHCREYFTFRSLPDDDAGTDLACAGRSADTTEGASGTGGSSGSGSGDESDVVKQLQQQQQQQQQQQESQAHAQVQQELRAHAQLQQGMQAGCSGQQQQQQQQQGAAAAAGGSGETDAGGMKKIRVMEICAGAWA